jgi:hypothetical protein
MNHFFDRGQLQNSEFERRCQRADARVSGMILGLGDDAMP